VVAEGVETPEQLRFLRSKHCYSFQGYLFSKPLPADEITGMLRAGKPLTPAVQKTAKNRASVSRRVRPARPRQGAA
jgi:predicted signal transduction protein with EAL and GGDEF domain